RSQHDRRLPWAVAIGVARRAPDGARHIWSLRTDPRVGAADDRPRHCESDRHDPVRRHACALVARTRGRRRSDRSRRRGGAGRGLPDGRHPAGRRRPEWRHRGRDHGDDPGGPRPDRRRGGCGVMDRPVTLYDTTLRDGTQGENITLSLADKLRVARMLDEYGMPYIEGGWPGSNPKDIEFFREARRMTWRTAKLAAFGSTRHRSNRPEDDANLRELVAAETPVVTIFGKSWLLHVTEVLGATPQENLDMIADSVGFVVGYGRELVYDAEHFFDGYRDDRDYALSTLRAAREAGARTLVLCDTNGGTLTNELVGIVADVQAAIDGDPEGVGRSAFAHKGGVHGAAVAKVERSYQHIDPAAVGNQGRLVVSELGGRANTRIRAEQLGHQLEGVIDPKVLSDLVKQLESEGLAF